MNLYGNSIAFAVRSVDQSLFTHLIPYGALGVRNETISIARNNHPRDESRPGEDLYGSSIAVANHFLDHSLFIRLMAPTRTYTLQVVYVIDNNPPPCYTESVFRAY